MKTIQGATLAGYALFLLSIRSDPDTDRRRRNRNPDLVMDERKRIRVLGECDRNLLVQIRAGIADQLTTPFQYPLAAADGPREGMAVDAAAIDSRIEVSPNGEQGRQRSRETVTAVRVLMA